MITFPNAKINLGLNITERRPDGYHNLETIFLPVELKDILEIVKSEKLEFTMSGIPVDGKDENNLIIKAYRMMQEEFGLTPVKIHLHKAIPMGAGLGGGSADAAFMLKMLNEEFELGLSSFELEKRAAKLGADCAFFIKDKPVMAKGIGNEFESTTVDLSGKKIVLVKPEIHISTAEAYGNCKPGKWDVALAEAIKKPIGEWKNYVANDFEQSVFPLHRELGEIKDMLYGHGAEYAAMSGSGSTIYGIYDKEADLKEINSSAKKILKEKEFKSYQLDL